MAQSDLVRRQRVLQRRFAAMGLDASLLPGGRTVVVTLPVGAAPFETPEGPRRLRAVRFFTVGHDHVKCLAPRALFYLPTIRVVDCRQPSDLEERIRAAWGRRLELLQRTRSWLDELGVEAASPQGAPQWTFAVGLEDERVRAAAVEPGRVILPSAGPLSGVPLECVEDRVFDPDEGCTTSVDLELAVGGELERLGRQQRRRPPPRSGQLEQARGDEGRRTSPILLVGSRVAADPTLRESLKMRGFDVGTARSIAEAVEAFRSRSYEVVLAETRLDRADGVELIPALRSLPGVQELPIALLDDRPRAGCREAARGAGASAYLAGFVAPSRIAPAIAHLASSRHRRRFTRFRRSLSVSWPGCDAPGITSSIGRRGMFVRTAGRPVDGGRYAIHIPEVGRTLRIDSEVVYRRSDVAASGAGLRFYAFEADEEASLIAYLSGLDHSVG